MNSRVSLLSTALLLLIQTTAALYLKPSRRHFPSHSLLFGAFNACDVDRNAIWSQEELGCSVELFSHLLQELFPRKREVNSTGLSTSKRSALDLAMLNVYSICDTDKNDHFTQSEMPCVAKVLSLLWSG